MIGKTLGHYQITNQLGKGGMGEVFQAKDQVLGRDVAIKVLPEEFAKDADRVARFQREAKLLASLNHPNIAAIYGLEESDGSNFLVLELVEGETLADRIKQGPIPVEESLKLALQITEALEAAHDKGVIHRDLKPANIKVTTDGKVKVLDFGLAKAYAGDQEASLSNSPTLSNMATQQGIILGTAAYMSPEQAKGKAVDKRADVWAFGCVVFEMLTGRSLFSADDVSQTLARVLERQPEFSALPRDIHPKIAEMLERCLEKDVRNRYSGISDARIDIRKALADPRGLSSRVQAPAARPKLKTVLPWIAALVVIGAAAGTAVWKLKPSEPRQLVRFDYDLPEGRQFKNAGTYPCLAISPDGKQIVYAATGGLYLRSMDALTSRHIEGTEDGAAHPFFSPDGKKIGYYSEPHGNLRRISINGGVPADLCNISTVLLGASWGADDRILYSDSRGIMRIAANGGSPEVLIEGKNETFFHPRLLPDGKSVLFTVSSPKVYEAAVQQITAGKQRKVLLEGDDASYLPSGHLVFALGNNLWAVPFDTEKNELRGDAVPIIQGVLRDGPPQYAVSPGGILAYVPASSDLPSALAQRTLFWVNHAGKEEQVAAPPRAYAFPSISPDGTKLALSISDGKSVNIWIWDLLRSALSRLTSGRSVDGFSVWTRDGRRIAFSSADQDKWGIYWKSADGTGVAELLSTSPGRYLLSSSWDDEGKTLVMFGISSQVLGLPIATSTFLSFVSFPGVTVGVSPEMEPNIAMVSVDGERGVKQLLQEKSLVLGKPQISPDGSWIAYSSNESGQSEVYLRPFPDVNSGKSQISTNGGSNMRWAPGIPSRRLFYSNSEAMMAVDMETGPAFKAGVPNVLFKGMNKYFADMWDLSPDGKRFLMIKESGPTGQTAGPEFPRKINVVLNFMEELNSRAPVK